VNAELLAAARARATVRLVDDSTATLVGVNGRRARVEYNGEQGGTHRYTIPATDIIEIIEPKTIIAAAEQEPTPCCANPATCRDVSRPGCGWTAAEQEQMPCPHVEWTTCSRCLSPSRIIAAEQEQT
jgi:hypothetical protein